MVAGPTHQPCKLIRLHAEREFVCMQQLSCSYGGVALPDAGVPKWRPGWSRRGEADVRTLAEAVAKMVVGGRGSKRRRRKREGL
jgi:hypothetical protein